MCVCTLICFCLWSVLGLVLVSVHSNLHSAPKCMLSLCVCVYAICMYMVCVCMCVIRPDVLCLHQPVIRLCVLGQPVLWCGGGTFSAAGPGCIRDASLRTLCTQYRRGAWPGVHPHTHAHTHTHTHTHTEVDRNKHTCLEREIKRKGDCHTHTCID